MYLFARISFYAKNYLWIYVQSSGMHVHASKLASGQITPEVRIFELAEASTNELSCT